LPGRQPSPGVSSWNVSPRFTEYAATSITTSPGPGPTVPVSVSYTLTPLGVSLAAAVATMRHWAYDHMDEVAASRDEYDANA
jgi:predicted outer membrane lipoprotein